MNDLKISIITVCFNSEEFIRSAIESVLSQTYQNIEYIIIDGGSSDSTVSIVKSFGEKITHLVSEPDMGIYDAMNKGLALATGEVIGILNSDDFYLQSGVISDVVKAFNTNSEIDMVLGDLDYVYPDDLSKPIRFISAQYFKPWKMRFGLMPGHTACFVKREAYQEVGLYKTNYIIAADFEWFIRAFFIFNLNYSIIDATFVRMRLGGVSSKSLRSNFISSVEMARAFKVNFLWSNYFLVSVRLPIKFFKKYFY